VIVDITLHPRQHDFYTCPDKIAAYIGGIRSGKSYAGVLWAIEQASKPGAVVLIVAPTYPMLRDIDWEEAVKFLGTTAKYTKAEMRIDIPGAGRILFRSADAPDRIRGISANAALIDEAGYCPADTYDIVMGRLSGAPGLLRIVTTPKGRNWLYQKQNEMTVFRSTTFENTALPPEYLEMVKSAYTGNFARQELYGEFVAFEGLVYPMFSRDVHVCARPREDMLRFLFGEDEGYTNPSVLLDIGLDSDGRVHIFREWYRRGQLQDTVVALNKKWSEEIRPGEAVVDASAAGLIAALRDAGVPAVAHKGRVLDGIGRVQNALAVQADKRPRLTIDPSCVQTIAEFESYVWKEGKDEPEKQGDHAMDALRYCVDEIEGGGAMEVVASPFDF
jgi:PBSX family phage terminase large subunit